MHPKTEKTIQRLIELWPLWVALGSGTIGYMKLKWDVADMRADIVDMHTDHQDTLNRLAILETDVQWLKKK